jgi:ABC-type antimicrobial peptide transport system permease subunit
MALGADHRDVVAGVLRHGIGLAALGLIIGLGLAVFAVRVLESFLFEMTAFDPGLFGIAAAVLAATAALASFVPARRATRVDPATALRSDG